jgi:hypothetical protein
MFILGQGLGLMFDTVPRMKELSIAANKPFSLKAWWSCDWNLVVGTMIIGAMFIIGLDQLIQWKPGVLYYVKWFFAGLGAFGGSVAAAKWSKWKKTLIKIVDIKSNVSDSLIGQSQSVEEVKVNFKETTGNRIEGNM